MTIILYSKVFEAGLAYGKGGGFLRCLTLFANVDFDLNANHKSGGKEYNHLVSIMNETFSPSILESLHWTPEVHQMTEKVYGLKYEYELQFNTVPL